MSKDQGNMKYNLLYLSLLFLHFQLFAQNEVEETRNTYANTITQEDLKKHLTILASDEYEGRETGTKGQKMAAEYIANHFKDLGLVGPVKDGDNAYYQPFTLEKASLEKIDLEINGKTYTSFEDFSPYGSFDLQTTTEIIFAGYGIEDEKYSDYDKIDAEGKLLVMLPGEPTMKDGNYLISGSEEKSRAANTQSKWRTAQGKGALGILILDENYDQRASYYKARFDRPSLGFKRENTDNKPFGFMYVSYDKAAEMLGLSLKKFKKTMTKMNKKNISMAGKLSEKVTLDAKRKVEDVITENVLGYLEGTDLKEELLVITSHYDHIGINAKGEINNGADDDGSGTVGVLEIAEAFTKAAAEDNRPRRSILFMTVTGEEKGLLGSQYYSENPIFEIENTVANLNIDMIGRVDEAHEDNPNYVYIIGSDMLSSELHNLSEEVAKKYKPNFELDYTYNDKDDPNRFYYRSDHYNFAKFNIPVIFYFNGTHPDYHKPTDTVDKIHFEKLMNTSQLVFQTAWEIVNRDKRLVVDKAESDDD